MLFSYLLLQNKPLKAFGLKLLIICHNSVIACLVFLLLSLDSTHWTISWAVRSKMISLAYLAVGVG